MMRTNHADSRIWRLWIIYGVALAAIATTMITSSWLLQHSLNSSADNARLVNISGRQRMLSQRLTKAILALPLEVSVQSRGDRFQEVKVAFREWTKAHNGLKQGDSDLGLSKRLLSERTTELFNEIEPSFLSMSSKIAELIAYPAIVDNEDRFSELTSALLKQENVFLKGMDAITFQFDKESRERIDGLQNLEHWALVVGLLLLALEALFIFKPSLRHLQKLISDLKSAKNEQEIVIKTLESTLNRSTKLAKEAKAAAEAKSEFLATMSHELLTPLNGIMGMLELMQMTHLDEEQQDYSCTALSSSKQLLSIINQVLEYSRLDNFEVELGTADIDIRELTTSSVVNYNELAQENQVKIQTRIADEVPEVVTADPRALHKVLNNLIDNAVRYTSEGKVTLDVEVAKVSPQEEKLVIKVSDTGCGISNENLDLIFEPFKQDQQFLTRSNGGVGLGLATCKKLVELMGGSIGVSSRLHQGSTFWFELPICTKNPA